jgi:excisionase family DNA binding protein
VVANLRTMSEQRDGDSPSISNVEPRLFTIADVAKYLSVSEAQVYAIVRSGELPAVKLGGRGVWRVDRHKLEEYIERLHDETRAWTEQHPLNDSDGNSK